MTTRRPRPEAIVIGGSAGVVEVLGELLAGLPADYALPIAVVAHVPRDRPSVLAEVLAARLRVRVKEAEDKEPLAGGTVYVAVPGYHLLVDVGPALALSVDDPVGFSVPAVDVLFESAAVVCRARLVGIVLSGANDDGARGLRAVQDAGGVALVQSPDTAAARAMPEAAIARCPEARVLTVVQLREYLIELPTR